MTQFLNVIYIYSLKNLRVAKVKVIVKWIRMGRGCIKKLPHILSSLHSGITVLLLQIVVHENI